MQIFKVKTITHKETVDFWSELSQSSKEKKIRDTTFHFWNSNNRRTITLKSDGFLVNPDFAFIQATIIDNNENDKAIRIEPLSRIKWIFGAVFSVSILLALLELSSNNNLSLIILVVATLLFRYNYNKINKAIAAFETILNTYRS